MSSLRIDVAGVSKYRLCACGCGEIARGVYKNGHRPIKRYRWKDGSRVHRVMAEKALGKSLPLGAEIHHVDKDIDNPNARLVICQSPAYHRLLHLRTKILRSGGNPNTDSYCCRCKKPKHKSEFYMRKASSGHKIARTITTLCKQCNKEASNEWRWRTGRRRKGQIGRPKGVSMGLSSVQEMGEGTNWQTMQRM